MARAGASMCLAKVYLNKAGATPIMEEVARIKVGDGRVAMSSLFGEEKVISGRVVDVDFAASRVTVEVIDTSARKIGK